MATGIRQGDTVSILAFVVRVADGKAHILLDGSSAGSGTVAIDPSHLDITKRSIHQNDEVAFDGALGWVVASQLEDGIFLLHSASAKAGDPSGYKVAKAESVEHAEDFAARGQEPVRHAPVAAPHQKAPEAPITKEPVEIAKPVAAEASVETPVKPDTTAKTDAPAPGAATAAVDEVSPTDAAGIGSVVSDVLASRGLEPPRSLADAGTVETIENPLHERGGELVLGEENRIS